MRHSVETRLPFLDYNALEVALSINTNYKIKDQYVWIVALFSVLLVLGIGNIDSI